MIARHAPVSSKRIADIHFARNQESPVRGCAKQTTVYACDGMVLPRKE